MLRKLPKLAAIASVLLIVVIIRGTTVAQDDIYWNRMSYSQAMALQVASVSGNRLINGDFDQLPFYWRPPNHYVAGMWYEWWADDTAIPEYIDGGIIYHNECYPMPASGVCHNKATQQFNSSQGYIRWGAPFSAGIYQGVPNLEPCTLYKFEIYNRNDSDRYGARVGIEPHGWVVTRLTPDLPYNCPPDGQSMCPHPHIGGDYPLPDTVVWSAPSYHPAFTWEPLSVTAEAAADTVSVWTYAAPDASSPSQSTYWDYGSLVQVPFPDGKLPAPANWTPSSFIQNVATTFVTPTLTIQWTTDEPASTQIIYAVATPPISPTVPFSYTAYFPVINQAQRPPYLDTQPTTNHQASVPGLRVGHVVRFVALSRRVAGAACATEARAYEITIGSDQLVQLDASEAAALYAQ